ncbi:hypothetical protein GCM10007301_00340 [Azorhizobium oxalatiphilum]|uniref:Localization factor PodJL n=1 Tax=Azorhizobium oxalatiphilum TaxID=980631 RepID=A0A917BJ62_9HYPH|nr:tetratricopeptide repeat protein [Azorhizobium oxalatiphilum]GGF44750.1 hypothetical protein GCM10007301_00340 [Azorhizobium oxalatiphilum]
MDRGDGTMYMAGMSAAAPSVDVALSPWTIDHLRGEVERLRSTYSFDVLRETPRRAPEPEAAQVTAAVPIEAQEIAPAAAIEDHVIPPDADLTLPHVQPVAEAPLDALIPPAADRHAEAEASQVVSEPEPMVAEQPHAVVAAAVAALSRKLDILDAKAVDPIAVARLQRQTAELKDLVASLLSRGAVAEGSAETTSQLQQIGSNAVTAIVHASADFERAAAKALETLETRLTQHVALQSGAVPVADEFQSLRERLDGLSREVKALGPDGDERLSSGIAQLLERLDSGSAVDQEALGPIVDVLEHHLVSLTERLGSSANAQLARLDGIERLLQSLTTEMRRLQAGPVADAPSGLVEDMPAGMVADRASGPATVQHDAPPEADAPETVSIEVSQDELAALLGSLTRHAAARPMDARPVEGREVWQVADVTVAEAAVTEAPWQGELREMLSSAEQRRRMSGRAFADERLGLGDLRPGGDWSARHMTALEAALVDSAEDRPRPRSRTDWVAAADRAEHREKGAAMVRQRESARRLNLAVRMAAVTVVAAGLGFLTYKLTQQEGGLLGLQAAVSAPAMPSVSGGAPVDKALLGTLPPPVGPAALKSAATAGDPDAASEVGIRYADGKGTDVDNSAAMKWLAFGASRGSVPAAYRLGSMYEHNSRNLQEARKLYQWAADRGNLRSMHNLGVLYSDGIDGKPDWMNALNWFRKAAELGLRDSQYNLGVIYSRGLAGAVDRAEAWKWFSLAANQGDTEGARKRDEVAAKAEGGMVDRAKAAVAAFTPGKVVESANAVPVRPEWEVAGPADSAPRKSASR